MNEIVFENRNKNYGAYIIRKGYDDALLKSFGFAMLLLVSLVLLYRFLPNNLPEVKKIVDNLPPGIVVNLPPVEKPHVVEPPKSNPAPHTPNNTAATPVFVDSVTRTEPAKPNVTENTPGTGTPGTPTTGTPGTGDPGGNAPKSDSLPKGPQPFAEVMPEFPGGEAELAQYLKNRIRFTAEAQEMGKNGTMILRFVVAADGSIQNIEVLRKYGYGCEKQAIQVVSQMPKWKPGLMGGRPVAVYFTLPIVYRIQPE